MWAWAITGVVLGGIWLWRVGDALLGKHKVPDLANAGHWERVFPGVLLPAPALALTFVGTMLRSAVQTLAQGGVVWRGTKYPLDELRRKL